MALVKWEWTAEQVQANRMVVLTTQEDVDRAKRMFLLMSLAGKSVALVAAAAETRDKDGALTAMTEFVAHVVEAFDGPDHLVGDIKAFAEWCGTPAGD